MLKGLKAVLIEAPALIKINYSKGAEDIILTINTSIIK